jgi:hypothetical protein
MDSERYLNEFKRVCAKADCDVDDVDYLRKVILFRSNGLYPANMVVSSDGTFQSCQQLCNEQNYDLVKRHNLFELPLYIHEETAWQHEVENILTSRHTCALGMTQKTHLRTLAENHTTCRAFRKSLMESDQLDIVAIHFLRWDGTPRKSITEIQDAICLYPSTPPSYYKSFMNAAGAVIRRVMDRLLSTEAGTYSKLRCKNTAVHLIGEIHTKKFSGNFLPKFIRHLNKEQDTPQKSVIFVEDRPWNYDESMRKMLWKHSRPWEHDRSNIIVKDDLSPLKFWTTIAPMKHKYIPDHDIVFYDYRYDDLYVSLRDIAWNGLDNENGWNKMMRNLDTHIQRQYERLLPPYAPEEFSIMASDFSDNAKNWKKELIDAEASHLSKTQHEMKSVPQRRQEFIKSQGVDMVFGYMDILDQITDKGLFHLVQVYVNRGAPNIFVFMGFEHMPNTESLLQARLACSRHPHDDAVAPVVAVKPVVSP